MGAGPRDCPNDARDMCALLQDSDQILPSLLRVARHQVFVDPSRTPGNQTAVLIVAKQDDPIIDRIWPFAVGEEAVGVRSERPEEGRDVRVMPGDENPLSLLRRTQGSRQFSGLVIAKARIDRQLRGLRERLDR